MTLLPSPLLAKTSKNDLDCIRQVVWAEARGESKVGKSAVAHVILNRAKSYRKSPCSVVRERGQFKRGNPPKDFYVGISPTDPTGGATHFRTKDMKSWMGIPRKIRIGGHTFYGR
jgi:hypothetical protein